MKFPRLTLYVCSPCNLACQECIMQHHMAWDAHYHMSLEEVTEFSQAAEASGYKFEVTLSGGEPLLWRWLNEAVPVVRASKSVARLVVFTNALAYQRMTDATAAQFDRIRVSDYGHNAEAMRAMQARWPGNVEVVPRYGFWRNPREPVPASVAHPVQCLNSEVMLYGRRIYACPHALSISRVLSTPPAVETLSVPLATGFMDRMRELKRTYHAEICTRCISNQRVRDAIGVRDVNVSKSKLPQLHQIEGLRPPAKEGWQ